MKRKKIPGINIQWPISQDILSGEKIIETRTYPIPEKHIDKEILLIETPGPHGDFEARGVAVITFDASFPYKDKKSFRKDQNKHLVEKDSKWDWKEKPKHAWPIKSVKILKTPIKVPKKRGFVFTSPIEV
jgi:hypothetical protein